MMKTKATTYVRKLRVGDTVYEDGEYWEVTRNPVVENGSHVVVYLRPYPHYEGVRSRAYRYSIDARTKLS